MMVWESNEAMQAVAWALVHFLWQGTLVALLIGGVLAALRRTNARVRYAVAGGGLMLMLALPVATTWQAWTAARAISATDEASASTAAPTKLSVATLSANDARATRPGAVPAASNWVPSLSQLEPVLPWLLAAWLAGVVLLAARQTGGWWLVQRLRRQGTRPADEAWQARLDELSDRLGVTRPVRLLASTLAPVPAVVGWLRPVVLVPVSTFTGLTPRQLESILAHELAHVRRHDYLVNLLQTAVETLLFYHPAVWWLSRRVRVEREHCCDDLAVQLCGDRVEYARALTQLETLRVPLRLAMAADGGMEGHSLLGRVRRLLLPAEAPKSRPEAWLAGLLVVLVLGAGVTVQLSGAHAAPGPDPMELETSEVNFGPEPSPEPYPEPSQEPDRVDFGELPAGGSWSAEIKQDQLWLQLRVDDGDEHWFHGSTLPLTEFSGQIGGPDTRFELRRDAGTFVFEGRFNGSGSTGNEGGGTYRFEPNADYARDLERRGYDPLSTEQQAKLALFDVSRSFLDELTTLGYDGLALKDLVRFRIHDVSAEMIRQLTALGYNDVSPAQLVKLRIHEATPEFLGAMADAGYDDLSLEQAVRFRIHGVSPDFIETLRTAGYEQLSGEYLVRFRVHGVNVDYLEQLTSLGYQGLSSEYLVRFRVHNVSAEFIRGLANEGYAQLSPQDLVRFRIHGVDADLIRALRQDGFDDLSAQDLVNVRIHGRRWLEQRRNRHASSNSWQNLTGGNVWDVPAEEDC